MVKKILSVIILGCAIACFQFVGLNLFVSIPSAYAETSWDADPVPVPQDSDIVTEESEGSTDEGEEIISIPSGAEESDDFSGSESEETYDSEDAKDERRPVPA